jgi:hypothetical protein
MAIGGKAWGARGGHGVPPRRPSSRTPPPNPGAGRFGRGASAPVYVLEQAQSYPYIEVVLALALGVILGLVAVVGGVRVALVGIGAIVAAIVAFTRPEWLMLVLLGLVSQVIPERFNPYLRLGGRGLYVSDLIVLLLIGAIIVRLVVERGYSFRRSPLNPIMLIFLATVLSGVYTATRRFGISFSATTYDARILLYYGIFFAVTNLIRSRRQLMWLAQAVLLLGGLAAISMILQAVLGSSISFVDQSILHTETTSSGLSVIRFYHPGTVAAYVVCIVSICMLALFPLNVNPSQGQRSTFNIQRSTLVAMVLLLLTGCAVLLSLNRNLLLSAGLAVAVMLVLIRRRGWSRLASNVALAGAMGILAVVLLAFSPSGDRLLAYIPVLSARFSTLLAGQAFSQSDTLQWRVQELGYAWPQIVQHPIWGIGMANPYRPPFYLGDTLQTFIHNAYAWLWLKAGIVGLISYLCLGTVFVVRGLRNWSRVEPGLLQATTLGFSLAYLSLAASNFVAPFFVQDWSLALIGVMFGINEVAYALAEQSPAKVTMPRAGKFGTLDDAGAHGGKFGTPADLSLTEGQ